MTFIDFATCDRRAALRYLQQTLPSASLEDSPESISEFLDFVERDIVRVQDPMMYGKRIAINPGKKWDESHREALMVASKPLLDAQAAIDND